MQDWLHSGFLRILIRKSEKSYVKEFAFKIEIPGLLSVLTAGDKDAYVPGIIRSSIGK